MCSVCYAEFGVCCFYVWCSACRVCFVCCVWGTLFFKLFLGLYLVFVFSYLLHLKDPLLFSLKIETSNSQRGSLQTFKTLSF